MAASLPLPALHATHAGIWLAGGEGEVREASRGEAIARAAETPHIILNAPLVGQRLGYPELSGLDLLELFAFIHPASSRCRLPAGLEPRAGTRAAGERGRSRGGASARSPSACWPCSTIRTGASAKGRGRPTRRSTGSAGAGRRWSAPGSSGPSAASGCCSRGSKQWEEARERPPPRTVVVDPDEARASSTG